MSFERIRVEGSVTDALMHAMERAEDMQQVIVLYETKETVKTSSGGIFTCDDVTLSKINWLIDMGKQWLWNIGVRED